MNWYIAHAIMYMKCLEGAQDSYDLYENILLVEAMSDEGALAKAIRISEQEEDDEEWTYGNWTWDSRPARWFFGGIRKLLLCDDSGERPSDGTSLSYSWLTVPDEASLRKLIEDESVDVTYQSERQTRAQPANHGIGQRPKTRPRPRQDLPSGSEEKSTSWYIAFAIIYAKCIEGEQDSFDCFQNILMIAATSVEEAREKAMRIAKEQESDEEWTDGDLLWNGRPARWVFGDIRQLTVCDYFDETPGGRPGDGAELSHLKLTVFGEKSLRKLSEGEGVDLTYESGHHIVFDLPEEERKMYTRDAESVARYITDTFYKVQFETINGNTFFFYDSERETPFATILVNDDYDSFSELKRPNVFRLNIYNEAGYSDRYFPLELRELHLPTALHTQRILVSNARKSDSGDGEQATDSPEPSVYDYTALDTFMPHPVDDPLLWLCVLNPGEETFEDARSHLNSAYLQAMERFDTKMGLKSGTSQPK
jgi:hypothetical protein